ncbi:macrophage mannose receptor 1-like [Saccostrea cucullata]|uniref:macrophage mannose receptor 1-like n=1 Tax=Saccostrea cuccullata TaxID=36930 RepID=UPI002ED05861
MNVNITREYLEKFGFEIHRMESRFEPQKYITFLENRINSERMIIELTEEKKDIIYEELHYAVSGQSDNISNIKLTGPGQCMTSSKFMNVFTIIGQKQCIRKCLQNRQCKSVNYRKRQLDCELIAEKHGESGTSLVLDSECDYIEMENQPQELAGSCNSTSCKEECVALSSGKPFCINDKCPTSWQINGEKKYCFVYNSLKWQAAKDSCIWMGAHLLAIENETEQTWSKSKSFGNKWWIGGTDEESEGTFYWEHSNSTLNYTNWNRNDPNGGSSENCIVMVSGGVWNDENCDDYLYYICERKKLIIYMYM